MKTMRQDKLRKEDRKEERRQKRELAEKQKEDGILRSPEGKIMCPVPLVPCCRPGEALPKSLEDGVKLECTNPTCLFTKHLIHPDCFDTLEHGLLVILSNQGSARGWSEGHRKHNLWGKKGLSLHQRTLRCACGKGQMRRDEEAWKEREALLEPRRDKSKKKTQKTKNLPCLQFAKKGLPPPLDVKKALELDNHFLSSHSPPPSSETFIEDRYGPLKEVEAKPRSRKTTGASVASSGTSISRPSTTSIPKAKIPSLLEPLMAPIPKPKYPIGLVPIKSPEKPPLMSSVRPKTLRPIVVKRPELPLSIRELSEDYSPPPSTEVMSPWQRRSMDNLSPTNTTTSITSLGSSSNFQDVNPYSNCKDAAVQTDITSLCSDPTLFQETWIKVFSPIKPERDSGIQSIINSPKLDPLPRPLSPKTGECFGNERIVTPPPGFGLSDRRISEYVPEEGKLNDAIHFVPIPWEPPASSDYSLFHGPTLGLAEAIIQSFETRTRENTVNNNYCSNCASK